MALRVYTRGKQVQGSEWVEHETYIPFSATPTKNSFQNTRKG